VKAVNSVRRVGRGRRGDEKDVGKDEGSKNKKKMEKSCGGSGNKSVALCSLPHTCLEVIACHLDSPSALALYRVSRTIRDKLRTAAAFWKCLCRRENFQEFHSLLKEEPTGAPRLSWTGEVLHGKMQEEASHWHRVYLRGVEMRKNVCRGNFQLWRLFMTDKDSLPVKEMTEQTSFRELRSRHRGSEVLDQGRRVRVQRYWNESYLAVIQHSNHRQCNDIFVWKWEECQNPEFLYHHSLTPTYSGGLFPTAYFMWKQYFVLMPDTGVLGMAEERKMTSMIRTHDLKDGFRLVGTYDFPDDGPRRFLNYEGDRDEAAHLHLLGEDKAVALCRTPLHTLYIFSLPDCQLLKSVCLSSSIQSQLDSRPLEEDELDQRFLAKDNTLMFLFYHPDFFNDIFDMNEGPQRYGRLVVADFNSFLKSSGQVELKLDSMFDSNKDYVEKVCIISASKLLCVNSSGCIERRFQFSSVVYGECGIRFVTDLYLPCPEPLKEVEQGAEDEVDTDGPSLVTSRSGHIIAALRHFITGRKVHTYSNTGALLYCLQLDMANLCLEPRPSYISLDLDGAFLCVADQNKVVVWNSKTGDLLNTINIMKHYNYRDDPEETDEKFCWKGHTDFAFTEDGIIVIHSQRNYPAAADLLLFW